ncbi:MAG: DEAD/DEAH box helicase [Bacteroidaceae bacterium]|nr:DEAD/DEAH box helicase [Bacteroidaceae bacterium]
MPDFYRNIQQCDSISLEIIRDAALEALPRQYRRTPWILTNQGGSDDNNTIYTDELQLDAYLAAYVDWHKGKLEKAFELLDDVLPRQINIIDWGCGQALATIFIFDYIKSRRLACSIQEVILIEPSNVALERAEFLINRINPNISIRSINKKLDEVTSNDLKFRNNIPVYHLFSNILDIGGIDLKHLSQILYTNTSAFNTIICVSPYYYSGNVRITSFFNYFQRPLALEKSELLSDKTQTGYTYNIRIVKLQPNAKEQIVNYVFYPPVQLRASYELSAVQGMVEYNNNLTYYDVYAPFDLGASVSDDVHPIYAVLNNIITRGLYTHASPFVERTISKTYDIFRETSNNGVISFDLRDFELDTHGCGQQNSVDFLYEALIMRNDLEFSEFHILNEIAFCPLAIARIQKLLVEILISGHLDLEMPEWNVLVEENDVPCAALAFRDFTQMFNTLTSMSVKYEFLKLPKINLTIVSNETYCNSPLHIGEYCVDKATNEIKNAEYDLVIHYSTSRKKHDYTFSTYKAKNNSYFAIFSADEDNLTAERYVYTSDRIDYKPFVEKDPRGGFIEITEQSARLTYFLNLLFRKEKFRNGQLPILTRAMSNLSVIGLLPTGSGKSLTYQLAAMLQPGITVVIDPLISLMKDQYDGLRNVCIDSCTFINSTVADRARREEMMERSKIQFIFLSPERLCIRGFRNRLRNMQDIHVYFAYGVIDEVHCVSEWGHDFRFTYLHLGRNLYNYVLPKQSEGKFTNLTLFGLTATASFDVLADVERELSGNGAFPLDSDAIIRYENTNRLELQYHVIPIDGNPCVNKWDVYRRKNDLLPAIIEDSSREIEELLLPENIERIKKRFVERESISDKAILKEVADADLSVDVSEDWYNEEPNKSAAIVFCPHRRGSIGVNDTQANVGIASSLRNNLYNAQISTYVGGDVLTEQDRFISGETSIMVATKAFGMGIDKPNVRFTYNVNFSGSLEAFVQEAGRAGRDRKMALATILYCPKKCLEQNPKTRLMETVPVDYGVHKFFFDNNFIGEDFEKMIMYYLLTKTLVDVTDEEITVTNHINHRQVDGFMEELLSTNVGDNLVSYISYAPEINAESVEEINIWLRRRNYPVLVFRDARDLREGEVEFVATIEKAIYRMCCVGIIDDYTRDYSNSQFRIVTKRKSDNDYFMHLKLYLMRYYTEERAEIEMQNALSYRGDNAMQKCLGYITEFVYNKIATKRERAIRDIETFCEQAVNSNSDWLETNEDLKDTIYYYFNSKYAREDYVTESGEPYSLTVDTEYGKKSSYDILFKYMNVVDDNVVGSSGSPKDNIKHLQGAIRLIRRSLTDSNPALDFLNVYCLLYLNVLDNDNVRHEMRDSFINGYTEFKLRSKDIDVFYQKMELFIQTLKDKNALSDGFTSLLEEWQLMGEINYHLDWLNKFKKQYAN